MRVRWAFVLEHLRGHGGVAAVVRLAAQTIAAHGDAATVYLPGPSDHTGWEQGLEIVYYDPALLDGAQSALHPAWRRVVGLRRQMELRGRPDAVVAAHLPLTALYARIALGYGAVPILSWLQSPPERFPEPGMIRYADLHGAVTQGIGQRLVAIVREARRVVPLPNPIRLDVDLVPQPALGAPARLVFLGRLENARQRVDLCLDALARVERPWMLDIYGDGPDAQGLRQRALELDIDRRCTWHGWVEDPWSQIGEASALIVSSDFAGFGLVIAESLARGVPVISTRCGTGPAELIRPGENGWLVPTGDAAALANTLTEAIDGDLLRGAAANARASVAHLAPERFYAAIRDAVRYFRPDQEGDGA